MQITIRPPQENEYDDWAALYLAYCQFYNVEYDENMLRKLWSWLCLPEANIQCLVAIKNEQIIGLMHFREFIRPICASKALYLDDLFVSSTERRHGVGRHLIKHLEQYAVDHHCSLIRWIAKDDNLPARELYDSLASQTRWITYDLAVEKDKS